MQPVRYIDRNGLLACRYRRSGTLLQSPHQFGFHGSTTETANRTPQPLGRSLRGSPALLDRCQIPQRGNSFYRYSRRPALYPPDLPYPCRCYRAAPRHVLGSLLSQPPERRPLPALYPFAGSTYLCFQAVFPIPLRR